MLHPVVYWGNAQLAFGSHIWATGLTTEHPVVQLDGLGTHMEHVCYMYKFFWPLLRVMQATSSTCTFCNKSVTLMAILQLSEVDVVLQFLYTEQISHKIHSQVQFLQELTSCRMCTCTCTCRGVHLLMSHMN